MDFSIEAVDMCPLSDETFQVQYLTGHSPDLAAFPSGSGVEVLIEIFGPISAQAPDPHTVQYFYPDDPHKGCSGLTPPACPTGTCPKWVVKFKGKLAEAQPTCAVTGPQTCRCAGNFVPPPKEKPKHDGPGNYSARVTIDPRNLIAETDETNNVAYGVLAEDASPCPTGACCADGTCVDGLTATGCAEIDGMYHGDRTACPDAVCPAVGACQLKSGDCVEVSADMCRQLGGTFVDGAACPDDTASLRRGEIVPGSLLAVLLEGDRSGAPGAAVLAFLGVTPNAFAVPQDAALHGLSVRWQGLSLDAAGVPRLTSSLAVGLGRS